MKLPSLVLHHLFPPQSMSSAEMCSKRGFTNTVGYTKGLFVCIYSCSAFLFIHVLARVHFCRKAKSIWFVTVTDSMSPCISWAWWSFYWRIRCIILYLCGGIRHIRRQFDKEEATREKGDTSEGGNSLISGWRLKIPRGRTSWSTVSSSARIQIWRRMRFIDQ
jgi:hypothetical protein